MFYPINKNIENFAPYLRHNLVSNQGFLCINSLTKILPNFSSAILELRLQENQFRVDLGVNLLGKDSIKLPDELLKYPEWRFFQKIYQDWINDSSLLHKYVEHIWLEFDIEEKACIVPIPCIFFGINKDKFDQQSLIEMSYILLNRQLPSSLELNLKHCIDCLPTKASVDYLGVMLSRSEQAIRIVSTIQCGQILNYLKKIGWSGSEKTIKPLLSKLSEFTDHVGLSYDVGETVMPRIGIECHLLKQPKYESRWKLLLDYLVESNLCSEFKRDALLNWSGYSKKIPKSISLSEHHERLKWNNIFLKPREPNALIRRISHIKVVCNADKSLEAKAYLNLFHEPIDLTNLTIK